MSKPYFGFAQLDCKNYGSVAVWGGGIDGYPSSLHNEMVRQAAEDEYMSRLLQLQEEIKERYEGQLVDEGDVDESEEIDQFDMAHRSPPGTDRLWYS